MTAVRHPLLALIVATLFLSACQTTPTIPEDVGQQQEALRKIPSWQAEGKIAINMDGERQNASFKWQQKHGNYVIHLFGPFGQGATWLRRTSKGVSLENAEIGLRHAADAEQLMMETLGWQVPVSDLQYWIRGLAAPTPDPDTAETDERGLLSRLEQQGWQVTYDRYEVYEGWALPDKLTAERGTIKVTLVIKNWQLAMAPIFTE